MKPAFALALLIGLFGCRKTQCPSDGGTEEPDAGGRARFFRDEPRPLYEKGAPPRHWFAKSELGRPMLMIEGTTNGVFEFFGLPILSEGVDLAAPPLYRRETRFGSASTLLATGLTGNARRLVPVWMGLNPQRSPAFLTVRLPSAEVVTVTECGDSISSWSNPAAGGSEAEDELWVGFSRDCDYRCGRGLSTQLYELSLSSAHPPRMHCLFEFFDPAGLDLALHPTRRLGVVWAGKRLRFFEFESGKGLARQVEAEMTEGAVTFAEFFPDSSTLLITDRSSAGDRFWEAEYSAAGVSFHRSALDSKLERLSYLTQVAGKLLAVGFPTDKVPSGDYVAMVIERQSVVARADFTAPAAFAPQILEEEGEIVAVYQDAALADGGTAFTLQGVKPVFKPQ